MRRSLFAVGAWVMTLTVFTGTLVNLHLCAGANATPFPLV